ncbi:MAG: redoxin domain-containing protein [Acidobacteria bacterium]|nr:redoxin domain-containing protein [Acidobacteriota bacterium]
MAMDVGLVAALMAGVLSFLSPCVLPIVPGYLSFITGFSLDRLSGNRQREVLWSAFKNSVAFVIGFSLVFIALGAAATTLGGFLRSHLKILGQIAGFMIILLGFHLTGIFRLSFLLYDKRIQSQERVRGFLGALGAGVFFGFGWTPCVGPVLAGILALAAVTQTVSRGILLLAVYSFGLGAGFVFSALFLQHFLTAFKRLRPHVRKAEVAGGMLLLLIGVLILSDQLGRLSSRFSFMSLDRWVVPKSRTDASLPNSPVRFGSVAFKPGDYDFEAQFLDGSTQKLSDLKGKIVLVNFWATWCAPCKAEMPELLRVYREKKAHLEIIGVAEQSGLSDIYEFVNQLKIDYPIAIDLSGKIEQQYKVFAYPSSYFLAPDGSLANQHTGFLDEKTLRKKLAIIEKRFTTKTKQ